jgi:hypothetical protein
MSFNASRVLRATRSDTGRTSSSAHPSESGGLRGIPEENRSGDLCGILGENRKYFGKGFSAWLGAS